MKKKLIFCVLLCASSVTHTQTYQEKLGYAAAQYYGSAIFIDMLVAAGCKKYLKLRQDLYKTSNVKEEILTKLKTRISKKDYGDLSNLLASGELNIKKDFSSVFIDLNPDQCKKTVPEYESLFSKNKNQWDSLVK